MTNARLTERGINPKDAIRAAATAGTLTTEVLAQVFMEECVRSRKTKQPVSLGRRPSKQLVRKRY